MIEKLLKSTALKYAAIVALPLLALFYSPLQNFTILALGERVLLETEPVDPRDFLRGDYVMLDYKISDVDKNIPLKSLKSLEGYEGTIEVCVSLARDADGIGTVSAISVSRPSDGLYLKGFLDYSDYSWRSSYSIEYGLGVYYVPEGTGRDLELAVREGKVLADVRVLNGHGVLKGLEIVE
ncbi:MAG: GDYXXLXY domain-containing protein [Synergistaceae bacterium]|jgi:uncharacterized membrane-anchored protein|nr:GDYXXLXY domain-containing protein [Synergistaceae bacterium]